MIGGDDWEEWGRSDEPAMEGAGRHLQRARYEDDPPPPREPVILPDPTPAQAEEINSILANGRRKFTAPDPLVMHTEHARAVRSAFMEGVSFGSKGVLDDAEPLRRHAWERSSAHRAVSGNPTASNMIGRRVTCSDPAAGAITVWSIVALRTDMAWIEAHERTRDRPSILVPLDSVKLITGERLA